MLWLFRLFGLNHQQWFGHRADPIPPGGSLFWDIADFLWGAGNFLEWGAPPAALYWSVDDLNWGAGNLLQWTGNVDSHLLIETGFKLLQEDNSKIQLEV